VRVNRQLRCWLLQKTYSYFEPPPPPKKKFVRLTPFFLVILFVHMGTNSS
jgi:hypothetical protein